MGNLERTKEQLQKENNHKQYQIDNLLQQASKEKATRENYKRDIQGVRLTTNSLSIKDFIYALAFIALQHEVNTFSKDVGTLQTQVYALPLFYAGATSLPKITFVDR